MVNDLVEELVRKVRELSTDEQEQVMNFIDKTGISARRANLPTGYRPIWEIAQEITASLTPEDIEKLPRDGAANHDHYLYGAPKKYE